MPTTARHHLPEPDLKSCQIFKKSSEPAECDVLTMTEAEEKKNSAHTCVSLEDGWSKLLSKASIWETDFQEAALWELPRRWDQMEREKETEVSEWQTLTIASAQLIGFLCSAGKQGETEAPSPSPPNPGAPQWPAGPKLRFRRLFFSFNFLIHRHHPSDPKQRIINVLLAESLTAASSAKLINTQTWQMKWWRMIEVVQCFDCKYRH